MEIKSAFANQHADWMTCSAKEIATESSNTKRLPKAWRLLSGCAWLCVFPEVNPTFGMLPTMLLDRSW